MPVAVLTRGHRPGGNGWHWTWTMTLGSIRSGFGMQLTLAALMLVIALATAVAVRGRSPWHGINPVPGVLAAGSAAVIAVCTLTPRQGSRTKDQVQLVPFHTVHEYLVLHSPSQLIVFIGGNVILFVPLGFFAYLALGRPLGQIVALCASLSFSIEILQLALVSRSTDVDDLLTNTLGGFLGVVLAWAALRTRDAASAWGRAASPWPP